MTDTEKKDKVEYTPVQTSLFPDFEGERIDRSFRVKPRLESLIFELPVPKTEEEAQKYYGCDLGTLIEKGAKQMSYDKDSGIRKLLAEDPNVSIEAITEKFMADLPTLPSKKERKAVAKKQQAVGSEVEKIAAELNMTTAEVIAKMRTLKSA